MSSKYELTLSKNYVLNWNVQDAIREFLQNAKDQETTLEDNKMSINYIKEEQKLLISNKNSILEKKSLLLGTKQEDNKTIGQFGEGYKIALLVLTRLDKPVVIYNYGNKEIWTSRFVKSRRYEDDILTIFVDKVSYFNKSLIDNNLTIEINNITEEEYNETKNRTLFLQEGLETLNSESGKVLLGENFKGKIFVNGLFISNQHLEYGYDIKPEFLDIGRDRNLVNGYDIQQQTGYIWREHDGELLQSLIMRKCPDVSYLSSAYESDWYKGDNEKHVEELLSIADNLYETYNEKENKEEDKVIEFITSQDAYETTKKEYENVTPILVNYEQKSLLNKSNKYKEAQKSKKKRELSLSDRYKIWKSRFTTYLPTDGLKELESIIKEYENR